MYLSHYGLQKKPFDISPDPNFLWLGEKHREALSYLKYGVMENKGFLMITGDVGTGKTALIRRLTRLIDAATFVVTIPDPDMDRLDFFNFLADELKMNRTFKTKGEFLIEFKHFLRDAYSDHRKVLLIIDESQRLNHELLQEIRLLSNIDLGGQVLLNIFFVGQTEFNMILKEERNRTVRQRISASFHLDPLNPGEVKNYVVHRLRIAGASSQIFTDGAIEKVYQHSNGYPRLINILCDHALMTGYSSGATAILPSMVDESADDLSVTFAGRARAASADAFEPQPISAEDLESAVLTAPDPDFEPAPAVTSEAVVKQLALAAGERRQSFLRPFSLALATLLMLAGITYFVYKPVSDTISSLSQAETGTPPLTPVAPQSGPSESEPGGSSPQSQMIATDKAVTTEVPSAYKAPAENANGVSSNVPAADKIQNRSQFQGSASMLENDAGQKTSPPTPEENSAVAVATDSEGTSATAAKPVASPVIENSSPLKTPVADSAGGGEEKPAALTANTESDQAIVTDPRRAVIYFEHDSHDLPPQASAELARLASAAVSRPNSEVSVFGFTDSLGNEWYNRKLSQTRADIVRDFFVRSGISPDQIRSIGMGSEYPIDDNQTRVGRQRNRRVEIEIKFPSAG